MCKAQGHALSPLTPGETKMAWDRMVEPAAAGARLGILVGAAEEGLLISRRRAEERDCQKTSQAGGKSRRASSRREAPLTRGNTYQV